MHRPTDPHESHACIGPLTRFDFVTTSCGAVICANILEDVHIQFTMHQVFKSLAYIHSAGMIHRDLKVGSTHTRRLSFAAALSTACAAHRCESHVGAWRGLRVRTRGRG